MNEEISTVDAAWQKRILGHAKGTAVYNYGMPVMPWEVYVLLLGIFWIVLALLMDESIVTKIMVMLLLGGPCIALFAWRTFFYTKNWIIDIRLFERDGKQMARFVQMNGYDLICPVEAVLEMRNRVNAYDFVFSDGKRVRLPRPMGETYDIRHFPNCRYKQG